MENVTLFTNDPIEQCYFLGETLGYAVLDSGCNKTVCGKSWLNSYIDTLSRAEHMLVEKHTDNSTFRFGDGDPVVSRELIVIPIQLGSHKLKLMTSVVDSDVPLLISRVSLKRAQAQIDFKHDKLLVFDEPVDVFISETGHMCVSLVSREPKQTIKQVMFSCPLQADDDQANIKKIEKLHKQFAHPRALKLKELIRNSGVIDKNIEQIVDTVSDKCDTCKRFRRPQSRPVVTFPLASEFNEVIAMDLKFIDGTPILHFIDHATRYSMACRVRNKRAETIVESVLTHWIRVFGYPSRYFLTDNGGEFVNEELLELCEKFNVELKTTAAEAAWSNGLVERHHTMLADNVRKVTDDSNCSLDLATSWAVSAKNALSNVYGFSPNQLVFGRNISLPAVHHDKLSAQNETCNNSILARHLVALHKTRQAFISQESCEKLRRALNKQVRNFSDIEYQIGDKVYYKRNSSHEWRGPAKILGCDKSQYLLKHGGVYVRVHPCKLQLIESEFQRQCVPQTQSNLKGNKVDAFTQSDRVEDESSDNSDSDHDVPVHVPQNAMLTPPRAPAHVPNLQPPDLENIVVLRQDVPIPLQLGDDQGGHNDIPIPLQAGGDIDRGLRVNKAPKGDSKVKLPRALGRLLDHNKPGYQDKASISADTINQDRDSEQEENLDEEVFFGVSTNHARYDSAKEEELKKWQEFKTYVEVPDTGQQKVSCRWVCTEKVKAGNLVTKARLVARGFEEDKSQLRTDSPTCSKDSVRLLLAILSACGWHLKSIDIKSAYLQGSDIARDIYLKPPKEANTDKLWKLLRAPYGLVDAGRKWYIRIQQEFTDLGAKSLGCDRAVFIWENPSGAGSCGILISHVDDFLYGGNSYFLKTIIPQIRSRFKVGSEEEDCFKYLGLAVSQVPLGIQLSLGDYIEGMQELDTSRLGGDKKRLLNKEEITEIKHLVGQINWVASQCRPDISFENCVLGGQADKATVAEVFQANKVVKRVKGQPLNLTFPKELDLKTVRIVTFCDASHANLADKGSQGGLLVFLVDDKGVYSLVYWHSKRVKRVVSSSLSAECLTAVDAAETSFLLRHKLEEMLCLPSLTLKISVLCDNKSLVQAAHRTTSLENKRLQIDINMLREMLEKHEISELRWIPTEDQLANSLTKVGASTEKLRRVLMNRGIYDHNTGAFVF